MNTLLDSTNTLIEKSLEELGLTKDIILGTKDREFKKEFFLSSRINILLYLLG